MVSKPPEGEASSKVAAVSRGDANDEATSSTFKVSSETTAIDTTPTTPAPIVPLEGDHLNTDERLNGNWESRYPPKARRSICIDATYVAVIFILTVVGLLLTWKGVAFMAIAGDCTSCNRQALDRYLYFYLGGQFGGTLFGIKYLYNVVARGWWNIDRRLWRLFSPFLSGGLAVAVAALTDSGLLGLTTKADSGSAYFSIGFITGYFADSALRKMKEIADTVFGAPETHNVQSSVTKKP